MSFHLTIILTGAFVAASCALVGSFLVLRKLALLGDAISHAVLPGIVIAFLLTESLASLPMLLGASLLGVVTVFLVETLNRSRRLYEDTSIGVVFPALFSLGVILVTRYASRVHIDAECVLYGDIVFSSRVDWIVGGVSLGPRALWSTGAVLVLNLLLVGLLFKELKLASFDPELAGSLGYSPVLIHYVLMAAVSLTVVSSFESVGSILVVAMLVVPPATAYLLTHRLSTMLLLAVLFGVASAALGYWSAYALECSIAGAMATMSGVFFLIALLASPSHGLLARFASHRRLKARLTLQLLLLHLKGRAGAEAKELLEAGELSRRFGWSPGRVERAVRSLVARGLIEVSAGRLLLTSAGEAELEASGTAPLAHPH